MYWLLGYLSIGCFLGLWSLLKIKGFTSLHFSEGRRGQNYLLAFVGAVCLWVFAVPYAFTQLYRYLYYRASKKQNIRAYMEFYKNR